MLKHDPGQDITMPALPLAPPAPWVPGSAPALLPGPPPPLPPPLAGPPPQVPHTRSSCRTRLALFCKRHDNSFRVTIAIVEDESTEAVRHKAAWQAGKAAARPSTALPVLSQNRRRRPLAADRGRWHDFPWAGEEGRGGEGWGGQRNSTREGKVCFNIGYCRANLR